MWFVQKVQIRNWDPYIRVVLSGPPGSAYIVRYFRDGGAKSPPRTWHHRMMGVSSQKANPASHYVDREGRGVPGTAYGIQARFSMYGAPGTARSVRSCRVSYSFPALDRFCVSGNCRCASRH